MSEKFYECEGCNQQAELLVQSSWKHNAQAAIEGWVGENGDIHRGAYCPDCIASVRTIRQYQREVNE